MRQHKRKTDDRKVILQDRDGDYVLRVDSTEWETVQIHFVFTKDRDKAKVFTMDYLFMPNANHPTGGEFIRGFAGGRIIPC